MPQPQQHDLKALSRRWFEEVWNRRNLDVVPELADPNAVSFGLADGARPMPFTEFLPFHQRFIQTFSDFHIAVDDVLQEGDKTVVRITATGTHTGGAMGVPPTNRPVRVTGLIMIRWKDGRIYEAWNEFDAWGMMQQMTAGAPAGAGTAKVKQ